jgi:hypothetical protein
MSLCPAVILGILPVAGLCEEESQGERQFFASRQDFDIKVLQVVLDDTPEVYNVQGT